MKKMMIGVLSGLLFLAMLPLQSYADPWGCGGQGGGGGREMGMMHRGPASMEGVPHFLWQNLMRLDLSDKQKEALKAIKIRVTKETIRRRADLEIGRVELRELLDKDPVDMKAVEANLKKAEGLRTDLRLSHIKALQEVKAQLTPEQRAKLKENIRAHVAEERGQGAFRAHERMQESGGKTGGE